MTNPNEYERAIEAYADAVRRERDAVKAAEKANADEQIARDDRQTAWRIVKGYVNEGKIKPGIYRLKHGPDPYADALPIQQHHDYPDLFPLFR